MNTDTLAPVAPAAAVVVAKSDTDLFGFPLATREVRGTIVPIMSKTDATKQLGRRITFDAKTLAEFKESLKDSGLSAADKKKKRQEFLHASAIEQRQELGLIALRAAYKADDMAPAGRVPDVMELRKNGTLKLVSIESFHGKAKSETPTQKIARLERELREAKAAKADADAPEAETLPDAPEAETLPDAPAVIEGEPSLEG